jgi:hypothetical protein
MGEGVVGIERRRLEGSVLVADRCGLSSSFFQVTVVPAVIVSVAGAKAKLSILTVAGLAAPAAVSSGKATASSEPTPTAPSNRVISRHRCV